MGMDVNGIEPESEQGEYFRASVWSWRPIHCLIEEADQRFKLGLDLDGFDFNEGAGLRQQDQCDRLADALEKLVAENPGEMFSLDSEPSGPEAAVMDALKGSGWNVSDRPSREGATAVAPPAYSASVAHVREFITFLRSCGGFEIW